MNQNRNLPETPPPQDLPFVPLLEPDIRGNDQRYVRECLETGLAQGADDFVNRFERELCREVGAAFGVMVANGRAALHISILAAGINPAEEVIVPSLGEIGPADALRYVGAWPAFVDVDPVFGLMDVPSVMEFIEKQCRIKQGRLWNKVTGRKVVGILPGHLLGNTVQLGPLLELCDNHGLVMIEDVSQAIGAKHLSRNAGSVGHCGCFSFSSTRTITADGGGAVVTNDPELARRARYLASGACDDPSENVHHHVGFDYPMGQLQAALGIGQLEKLSKFVSSKRNIAAQYGKFLDKIPGLALINEPEWSYGTFWASALRVDESVFGMDCRRLKLLLATRKIQASLLWQPRHLGPAHQRSFSMPCPNAEKLYQSTLLLPSSSGLHPSEQERVIAAVMAAAQSAKS